MKRCVIIGAAEIRNYEKIKSLLSEKDFYIICDGGLNHVKKLNIKPDLIIGDFDSHENPHLNIETIVLPCVKDDTDTIYAAKEGIKRGFSDFLLLGAAAGRLDHTFGNLSILLKIADLKKTAVLADDYSEMQIVTAEIPVRIPDSYSFFSVINLDGSPDEITIKNAAYPLENGHIDCSYQYGISNQVLKGKTAEVSLKTGKALVIKVW